MTRTPCPYHPTLLILLQSEDTQVTETSSSTLNLSTEGMDFRFWLRSFNSSLSLRGMLSWLRHSWWTVFSTQSTESTTITPIIIILLHLLIELLKHVLNKQIINSKKVQKSQICLWILKQLERRRRHLQKFVHRWLDWMSVNLTLPNQVKGIQLPTTSTSLPRDSNVTCVLSSRLQIEQRSIRITWTLTLTTSVHTVTTVRELKEDSSVTWQTSIQGILQTLGQAHDLVTRMAMSVILDWHQTVLMTVQDLRVLLLKLLRQKSRGNTNARLATTSPCPRKTSGLINDNISNQRRCWHVSSVRLQPNTSITWSITWGITQEASPSSVKNAITNVSTNPCLTVISSLIPTFISIDVQTVLMQPSTATVSSFTFESMNTSLQESWTWMALPILIPSLMSMAREEDRDQRNPRLTLETTFETWKAQFLLNFLDRFCSFSLWPWTRKTLSRMVKCLLSTLTCTVLLWLHSPLETRVLNPKPKEPILLKKHNHLTSVLNQFADLTF